ncbi:MAG TPA: LysM peptidoglycan-binding domain-containing protein [Symbiobacteriaceae bacterium]|jgi:nucleoid-associated protein YgaU|nr:LysM peptidoglycan-binding domain-containing protein [Symbiobacteriaceae bacterium]
MGVENLAESVSNVKLDRAQFSWGDSYDQVSRSQMPPEQQFEVLYNPTEYSIDTDNQISETAIPGLGAPVMQFVHGRGRTLTMQLFIDTTEPQMMAGTLVNDASEAVAKITDLLAIKSATKAPPLCRVDWGTLHFVGVLLSAKVRYLLFNYKGKPLRATVDVTLREYQPINVQLKQTSGASPEQTKTRTIKQGETLSQIAAQEYGDASQWRQIAQANGIDDPRKVPAGKSLIIPPDAKPKGAKG